MRSNKFPWWYELIAIITLPIWLPLGLMIFTLAMVYRLIMIAIGK